MSKRKSILVVGVGSIGERHLRCFAATGRVDVSFCEVNPGLRQTIADRYRIPKVFENLEQALRERPDAVVICTPANLHVPMAIRAAKAGAHLLIEKPLATSLDGIEELQQEIVAQGLVAGVAYVYRAHPALAAMRDALRAGRFGEPVQIVATSGQHFPHYRPAYRDTYYKDRATGGGAVQDALTHAINAGEWLAGPVDRLVADLGHKVLEGVEVEDTVHVLTQHDGVMGCFSLNQHQAPNESTITVICQRGTARFEFHNGQWRSSVEPGSDWSNELVTQLERDTLFTRQAEAFLDAMDGLGPPLCSIEEALQTLRVNLSILASAETRLWEKVK